MSPITTRPNSKVACSCTIIENIYTMSIVEKLVWGNLISLFCIALVGNGTQVKNGLLHHVPMNGCSLQ